MRLLRCDSSAQGACFERAVFPVDPASGVDIVAPHKAALFVTLEEKNLEAAGLSLSQKNDCGCFLWDGGHRFSSMGQCHSIHRTIFSGLSLWDLNWFMGTSRSG